MEFIINDIDGLSKVIWWSQKTYYPWSYFVGIRFNLHYKLLVLNGNGKIDKPGRSVNKL